MKSNPFVKPLNCCLSPTDGKMTLRSFFGKHLNLYRGCGYVAKYISPPTGSVEEFIGVLSKDGTTGQIYDGFGTPLNKLSHTPAQACALAISHQDELNLKTDGALVLLDVDKKYFILEVTFCRLGFFMGEVYPFARSTYWTADGRRIVVPQQKPLTGNEILQMGLRGTGLSNVINAREQRRNS